MGEGEASRTPLAAAGAAVAALLFFYLAHSRIIDPDIFHEMALAREAIAQGRIPTADTFAYTPTIVPVVHHEWGTGFVLFWVAGSFGAGGIAFLKIVLGFAAVGLAVAAARTARATWETLLLLAPLAIALADVGFTNLRAQSLSLVCFGLLLLLLARDGRGSRGWIVPWLLVHLVWLNLHGGFVAGGLLLAGYAVEAGLRTRRVPWHLVATGAAMAALVPLNPYGLDTVLYLARALAMPRPRIGEWQPVWVNPAFAVLLAISLEPVIYAAWRLGVRALSGGVALLLFLFAAVLHGRHLSLYALVWLAVVPAWIDATPLGLALRAVWPRARRAITVAASAIAIAALVAAWRGGPLSLELPVDRAALAAGVPVIYPEGAVAYLREQGFHGNVMTPFEEGAFVSWRLHPVVKVGLDSRYEVAYAPGVAERIWDFYAGAEGWSGLLERYPTDLVLVKVSQPVGPLLATRTSWPLVYQDDVFQLFARPGLALPHVDRRGLLIVGRFP